MLEQPEADLCCDAIVLHVPTAWHESRQLFAVFGVFRLDHPPQQRALTKADACRHMRAEELTDDASCERVGHLLHLPYEREDAIGIPDCRAVCAHVLGYLRDLPQRQVAS